MFTSHLPDEDYRVVFSEYSKRHYIKSFEKSYPGRQWVVTEQSIFDSLKRVHAIRKTQQVDELWSGNDCIVFKYDFAVAKTKVSPKASGNRCIVFLDRATKMQTVLLVYSKTDLPKNQSETRYISEVFEHEFAALWLKLSSR